MNPGIGRYEATVYLVVALLLLLQAGQDAAANLVAVWAG